MKSYNKAAIATALAGLFALPTAAMSGTLTVGSITGQAGDQVVVPVSFSGDGTARDFRVDFSFDGLTFISGASPGDANCLQRPAPNNNQARTLAPANATNAALTADEVVHCNFTLEIPAAAVAGDTFPLAIQLNECFDADGNDYPCAATNDGLVTVTDVGPLSLDIDETVIAFGAGTTGTNASEIRVGTVIPAVGGTGNETASFSCVATPAGLTVAPATGNITNASANVDFAIGWTYGAALANGEVNCTVTDSDGVDHDFTIDVTAPAGTDGAPALSTNPAAPGPITVPGGAPGNQTCTNISISAAGGAGVGVSATAECTSNNAAVTVTNGGPLNFAPGAGPQNVQVCVTLTDAPQEFANAVTCDINDANGAAQLDFNVGAPAGQNAPVFVPASSLWSKLALFGIFAALGGLVLGLRRNH